MIDEQTMNKETINEPARILAARWIIPVSRDPINGGWIRIEHDRIAEIGTGTPPAGAEDLGDAALLPGLVNAHTHLEFSDCSSPIGAAGVALHQWIGQVIAARRETTADSKREAIEAGLKELRESGTRLAGEITTAPCDYPSDVAEPELITFAEVLGLQQGRADERLEAAVRHNITNRNGGWSPHAPYSTSPRTIRRCVELAAQYDRPLAMHVAESPAERELLCEGTGPFADTLRSLGVWRDDLFPWGKNPYGMLIDSLSKAPRVVMIHGNDLNDAEIERLRSHSQITVVYCPRTHAFFGHVKHPVDRMLAAGVRVALGTDSRASNPDLNLWREVQFLLKQRADLAPEDILRMATLNGADAFGRSDLGRIEVGCQGGIGFVQTDAKKADDVYADFVQRDYSPIG
jgi:cytosine/adenosine deaminase-related metal-dependent hydrolase